MDKPTVSLPLEMDDSCGFPICEAFPKLEKGTLNKVDEDQISALIHNISYYIEPVSILHHAGLPDILDELLGEITLNASLLTSATGVTGPPLAVSAYQTYSGNITDMMNAIATSLTTQMRQQNSTNVYGEAWAPSAFVHVRWSWLIYQAARIVFACLFLAMTVIFSTEKDKLILKSSSIALLFHGMQVDDADRLDSLDMETMEARARKMQVVLAEDDKGGISFVRKP